MERLLDRSTLDGELWNDNAATERLLNRTRWRDNKERQSSKERLLDRNTSRWRVIE